MSPNKEEIMPSRTKEHFCEEISSQNAPIIQEPLPTAPVVRHQRSGSRSRPKLAARLTSEMTVVTANMRAISRQKAGMHKLLKCMQIQLIRSSQNEEVVPLEIGESAVPVESSRANALRGQASVFNRLGHTRDGEGRPPIPPFQIGRPPIFSNRPHMLNSFSEENQHGQPQPRITDELALRYMNPLPRNRSKRLATLARMRTYQN
ncbi:Hypothetical predicted protein [Olea europaea subsp. europaea]|uniref:Uncharacterized protein n=1 Tax=Olea europaea subsp. europaea TaxID=158383 RepID=A0A8S0RQH3_OLEEU|nr:Hypothetical predicted protein [Olea europaea subsp. europaea]